jgi:hypothetical protein
MVFEVYTTVRTLNYAQLKARLERTSHLRSATLLRLERRIHFESKVQELFTYEPLTLLCGHA